MVYIYSSFIHSKITIFITLFQCKQEKMKLKSGKK